MSEYEKAVSILYGILRGAAGTLELEEQDISGCLQGFYHPATQAYCYGFVLYDTTPGGAGHASCYACLRAYGNQKIHDKLKRSYVIEFLRKIGIKPQKKTNAEAAG